MTALPDHIQVGPMCYSLAVNQAAINAINPELQGRTTHRNQSIVLAEGIGPDQEADTVLHELLHACLSVSGAANKVSDGLQEELVAAITPLLLDVLRRNPQLVAYLLSTEP